MNRRGAAFQTSLGRLLFCFTSSLAFILAATPSANAASTSETISSLQKLAIEKHLAASPVWLKLGHYRKSLSGGYSSEAGGDLFWVSPQGSGNPEVELLETIRSFYSSEPNDEEHGRMHPICRLPARFHWLSKELSIDERTLPKVDCKMYRDYLKRMSADSIAVVFSSYYMSSSASVFGHTFLRVHRKGTGGGSMNERDELLNYGINYGADATTKNPVLYAIFGMAGLFRGTYSNVPYYYKIREYNDYEARDLWSYELNLTQAQVDVVLDHLWELGSTWFPYYFFTENCSYQILTALAPAVPDVDLLGALRYWVIPSDSVKSLTTHPGLVRRVDYRPSITTEFVDRLSDVNTPVLETLVKKEDLGAVPESMPVSEKVKVYDAAMDYVDMKNPDIMTKGAASPAAKWKHQLLIARATLGVPSEDKPIPPPLEHRPDLGHGSARAAIGGGYDTIDHGFMRFQMRFALHDLLDSPTGYPSLAQIEFMNLKARYAPGTGHFRPQELGLIRTTTVHPWTWYDHGMSSSLAGGIYEIRDPNCNECKAGRVDGGVGESFALGSHLYNYNFIEAETAFSPSFYGSSARIGAGPRVGLLIPFSDHLRALAQGQVRALLFATHLWTYQTDAILRWTPSPGWALEASGSAYADSSQEAAANLYFYF